MTYAILTIASLLGILGIFLKTTDDSKNKSGVYFKKLTVSGWIVLSLMIISFSITIIDQHRKDIDDSISKAIVQHKDSLNTIRIQQLLEKSKSDSINADYQKKYLTALLSSSKKISSTQAFGMEKANNLNDYLRAQLKQQQLQNDRLLNPLESLSINYRILIPANQRKLLRYKERINKLEPTGPSVMLVGEERFPDINNAEEASFAFFLYSIYAEAVFKSPTVNGPDKRSMSMHSEVSFSRENLSETNFIFTYDRLLDAFLLSFDDLTPRQISRADMLSLKDFSNKNVVCIIRPGSEPDYLDYNFNSARCIDFSLTSVTLMTKSGRYLNIARFKQTDENRDFRTFQTKLEKDITF